MQNKKELIRLAALFARAARATEPGARNFACDALSCTVH